MSFGESYQEGTVNVRTAAVHTIFTKDRLLDSKPIPRHSFVLFNLRKDIIQVHETVRFCVVQDAVQRCVRCHLVIVIRDITRIIT
jgi:hypothetical protein